MGRNIARHNAGLFLLLQLLKQKKHWHEIEYYGVEINCGEIQPDAVLFFANKQAKTYWKFFVEIDRDGRFKNKVPVYEEYAKSGEWVGEWWARARKHEEKARFPRVLVVTEHKSSVVKAACSSPLKILPATPEEIGRDILNVMGV